MSTQSVGWVSGARNREPALWWFQWSHRCGAASSARRRFRCEGFGRVRSWFWGFCIGEATDSDQSVWQGDCWWPDSELPAMGGLGMEVRVFGCFARTGGGVSELPSFLLLVWIQFSMFLFGCYLGPGVLVSSCLFSSPQIQPPLPPLCFSLYVFSPFWNFSVSPLVEGKGGNWKREMRIRWVWVAVSRIIWRWWCDPAFRSAWGLLRRLSCLHFWEIMEKVKKISGKLEFERKKERERERTNLISYFSSSYIYWLITTIIFLGNRNK